MNLTNAASFPGQSRDFADFYALREDPFGQADPRFIYLGANHRKALAALHYGIERGDAAQLLLADAGLGKTTLLRHLHVRLQANASVIFVAAAELKQFELLRHEGILQKNGHAASSAAAATPEPSEPASGASRWRLIALIDDAHQLSDEDIRTSFWQPGRGWWKSCASSILQGLCDRFISPR